MFFIYDTAVIAAGKGVSELSSDLSDDFGDKSLFDTFVAENIVRSDAGLSAVEELAEDDASGSKGEIGRLIDYTRALAAEFQDSRGQIFRGMAENLFTDALTSGKKDHIEFLFEQSLIFAPSPCDSGYITRLKAFGDETGCNGAYCRRIGARFDDGGVSGGDGVSERFYREQKRIIPWTHDKDVAVGGGFTKTS